MIPLQYEYKAKLNVENLKVSTLLENDWEEHYDNQIFKCNGIVHMNLAVKKGSATKVLTLPERI